ncbi:hypothetical protein COX84_06350 [Candidatus Micrarchaeota archaeon CG_4_10_14_0_2_um_filter_49_7]|nr:MAG: hypothetical protein AUJ13_01565 [Candidatus Micrarchaeota archaeon CG1_02_49_24]PIU81508.1 MAG: hypothetical protein COS70_03705 [Candidatus Micrarchaeota archaeon CG06_land_8_20_14_3_00_50_6]PIZ92956.1 MAG: hypothetical protein COX84_06350 [Candidatus Micrarchaeota archaeon CG_4_10_14_0_2_um_filter_49_7]
MIFMVSGMVRQLDSQWIGPSYVPRIFSSRPVSLRHSNHRNAMRRRGSKAYLEGVSVSLTIPSRYAGFRRLISTIARTCASLDLRARDQRNTLSVEPELIKSVAEYVAAHLDGVKDRKGRITVASVWSHIDQMDMMELPIVAMHLFVHPNPKRIARAALELLEERAVLRRQSSDYAQLADAMGDSGLFHREVGRDTAPFGRRVNADSRLHENFAKSHRL